MAQSKQIAKVNWWHEQIVDWELENPDGALGDAAEFFGVTQSWLSTVRNSNAFIDYRNRRMGEHRTLLSLSVIDKVENLAHVTLDAMQERVEQERHTLGLTALRETAAMALKACGYGPKPQGNTPTLNVNVGLIDPARLAAARERMRQVQALQSAPAPAPTSDATPQPLPVSGHAQDEIEDAVIVEDGAAA